MSDNQSLRVSQALDNLAKTILEQRDSSSYNEKLRRLEALINMILQTDSNGSKMDTTKLDSILREDDIEIIEKNHQRYALIPVIPLRSTTVSKNKKKNKIRCSYCNEMGHTRANCEKKLQPQQ
ncbi:hypothetical protein ZYGR_0AD01370 [Zygosaccharomyces rouxii]|uniref:ZYRO0G09064p n=2 Tax=Zygosaccharomyces rouxii TaxID=4956 RepID=C5E021_ZYGRC|nr:uncharacterized protein ZYRO0G09064g [Zygosaccharomyces rouxii]KAH9202449.1 hypothetical protein LQ764DRAFT_232623 [Zygosaccharomyces rouxii]GAV50954.1 hypothetical protein ZYGR_0AD01370 [Zygosaccharomyces rouxii]CAR29455.1 ZYRO0G09064p [Zygosaccharomyces rouxii]